MDFKPLLKFAKIPVLALKNMTYFSPSVTDLSQNWEYSIYATIPTTVRLIYPRREKSNEI